MAPAVPRAAWVESLERFSREHRAWLAFVEPGAEHPLRGVQLESGLDIESPQGVTRLRFRATAASEALDGLAPGER